MDIASLHAFIAVATSGSFSAAAEQLYLTQPAVSKRIGSLEAELGIGLFDRLSGGRQIRLTEAGRTLLPRAQRILADIDDSRRALANLSGAVAGSLTIATSHHIGLHRLPPLLREFVLRYPEVRLDMRFIDSELGCEMVVRNEAELGIVTLPLKPPPVLACVALWDDPLAIVISREHELARIPQIAPGGLSAYPAILPGEITFTRRLIDQFFAAQKVTLTTAFSTNYLETIKTMVAVGLGWSVLPRSIVGKDSELVILDVAGFTISRTLGVVRHKEQTLSNAARAMLALLTAADHETSA